MEKNYSPLPVLGTVKRHQLAAFMWKNRHNRDMSWDDNRNPTKWDLYQEWQQLRNQKAAALQMLRHVNKALA